MGNLITSDYIMHIFESTMLEVLKIFWPFLVVPIVLGIIKIVAGNLVYSLSRMSGYGHRKAKKKSKAAQDAIDIASTICDLTSKKK